MNQTNKDKYDCGPKSFGLSARNSWFDSGDKSIPGPGAHDNIRMNKTNPPGWRIGTSSQRDTFLDKFHFPNPPSNKYHPKFESTHPTHPKYSIPQANNQHQQKHKDENNSLLYQPDYNIGRSHAPKFSMGYFQERDYSKPTPAPNQYHKEGLKQTQKSFFNKTQKSFSVSQRPLPYGEQSKFPGATKYHIQNYKNPSISFSIGSSQRPIPIIGKDSPGVFYKISGDMTKSSKTKCIMKPYFDKDQQQGTLKGNNKNDFPSPDKYNPIYPQSKANIVITHGERSPLENVAVIKNPHPQKYNTQMDFYKRKSYSFTKDLKDRSYINQTPGPGTHQIATELGTKSGVIGKKIKQDVKFITPGADHYRPKFSFSKQAPPRVVSFYSNRVDFSKSLTGQNVGPGSYQIETQTRAEMGKISRSEKFPKNNNKNPGPGSYDISSGIGKLPQYYSGTKKITREGFTTFAMQKWEKEKKERTRLQQREAQITQKQIQQSTLNH